MGHLYHNDLRWPASVLWTLEQCPWLTNSWRDLSNLDVISPDWLNLEATFPFDQQSFQALFPFGVITYSDFPLLNGVLRHFSSWCDHLKWLASAQQSPQTFFSLVWLMLIAETFSMSSAYLQVKIFILKMIILMLCLCQFQNLSSFHWKMMLWYSVFTSQNVISIPTQTISKSLRVSFNVILP